MKTIYATIRIDIDTELEGQELEDYVENIVLTAEDKEYPMDIEICGIN